MRLREQQSSRSLFASQHALASHMDFSFVATSSNRNVPYTSYMLTSWKRAA